jgi:hypothetical protein
MVDSYDPDRVETSKERLWKIHDEAPKDIAILIIVSKLDRRVMTVAEVIDRLGLHQILGRKWGVRGVSITENGGITGLGEVKDWVYSGFGPKVNSGV